MKRLVVNGTRVVVYEPNERPRVTALVDRTWYDGELRMWAQQADGSWTANISYRKDLSTYHDTVPADHVRRLPD